MEVEKYVVGSKTEIPAILLNCAESIAKRKGFVSYSVKYNKLPADGSFYLSVPYEIDITGETSHGHREINLFVKCIVSRSETFNSILSIQKAYMVEEFMYNELLKQFKSLEKEANVPDDEKYKMVNAFEECSSEAIIMENLSKEGFKISDRIPVVPLKFVELSVQQLAKFHGLGFAMKIKMPNYYERNIASMNAKDVIKYNEAWVNFFNGYVKKTMKNLRTDLKKKVEIFITTATVKYLQYQTDPASVQTLCHGDFKTNNILMKELDGDVIEVVPVDFQLAHHGCPTNDILYFIYGCTDRDFRKEHMNQILRAVL